MNRGGVGARSLNIELQAALQRSGEQKVERFGWTFAAGDKVMQIENDYDKEVYNGDIGNLQVVDLEFGEPTASFDGPVFGQVGNSARCRCYLRGRACRLKVVVRRHMLTGLTATASIEAQSIAHIKRALVGRMGGRLAICSRYL